MDELSLILVFILFFVLFFVLFGSIYGAYSDKKKKEYREFSMKETLNNIKGFTPKVSLIGYDNRYVFAIDENSKQIILINEDNKRIVPFNKIISVDVIENNKTISSKSSARTIGGAVVGGAIAGGAGAIIGGLSGNTTNKKKVSKLSVKIIVRDINNPSLIIDCFDAKTMTYANEIETEGEGGTIYNQCVSHANRIADMISVIIDSEDEKEKSVTTLQGNMSDFIADELDKLAKLKEKGILTEEEFDIQKQRLLYGNGCKP